MRGDVDRARGSLKAGLEIDMFNSDLTTLAKEIKLVSDMIASGAMGQ